MSARELWDRYRAWLLDEPDLGFRMDVSRMGLPPDYPKAMEDRIGEAFDAMAELEAGAEANPTEKRMVGHYWLRAPELAPSEEIAAAIRDTVARIRRFSDAVHDGSIAPVHGERFSDFLLVGIGGSALGPQFVADALGGPDDRMRPHFLDNTDPDGIGRVLYSLGDGLPETLTIVVSKSGGTPETRNGMLVTAAAYRERGLEFGKHAVAITGEGSQLDRTAMDQDFLDRFPMWDWVGGRTSETSAVGLLPAALQGIDFQAMLDGAAAMDRITRRRQILRNPAALLALCWYHAGDGRGARDMVILPYKDRLALFSRYLQQLVMESLGKERDLEGNVVHQGIAVYGNKGSTDQHAYVQQLRDGVPNFFVTFVEVLRDGDGSPLEVEPEVTSGDFLNGFLQGTRQALHDSGRPSLTITVDRVDPTAVGALIALYERAVGLYATLIRVNAYDQPGVEAGKKAAGSVLALQRRLLSVLRGQGEMGATAEELASMAGQPDDAEAAFMILEHLAANPERGVIRVPGRTPFDAVYRYSPE
jgi:glucose-6-phosphate isomerase